MVLFTILVIALLTLIIFTVIGGAVGIVMFGDVIVCALLIIWIIKKLFFKKK